MKTKLFLTVTLCGLGIYAIPISSKENTPPKVSPRVTILSAKSDSGRPKAPSRAHVECMYSEDYLTFSFLGEISSYAIYMYNDTDEWYGYVSKEVPTVQIPHFLGTYTLECTADNGRVFIGTIEF